MNAQASYSTYTNVTLEEISLDYTSFGRMGNTREYQRRKDQLIQAVMSLPSLAAERGYKDVSQKSIGVALELLKRLPTNRQIPRVAADEDGDVLISWAGSKGECALTVEGIVLHMVVNPGSDSQHLEPTVYDGGFFPVQLLAPIPLR